MLHFRRMLRQAIKKSGIPNGRQWMETLSTLLVRASTSIRVTSEASDDQDIRNYVKVKKIPGGKISDSECEFRSLRRVGQSDYFADPLALLLPLSDIDGVVITKGFAHKVSSTTF